MCGICGIVSTRGDEVDAAPLGAMLAAMTHRGPDGEGRFDERGASAGNRRLAVIDLAGGGQPLKNEDGSIRVVLNGEIYNHRELRRTLEGQGHHFRTDSDTEVLVHLWEEHGPSMLDRLNGMFTFCLHDGRNDEVFVARDRVGIKPLYYAHVGDELIFASEPAVLLRHPAVPREIDPAALVELYCLQFVTGERTVYRGMRKLLPGHWIHVRNGGWEIRRYWEIPRPGQGDPPERPEEELRELLADAVRLRRIADVPIGAFLSGGLDSSVITSLLVAAGDEPVETFSVGFEEAGALDEREHARSVAGHLGTKHHELVVSALDVAEQLPRMVRASAEPLMDPAILPTTLLSEFARRSVKVALTGEGADELFGGYRRYLYQNRYGWLSRLPGLKAAEGRGLLPRRVGQALGAVAQTDPVRNHLQWISTLGRAAATTLFDADLYETYEQHALEAYAPYFESEQVRLGEQLRADQHEWLPHNLLAKVDRAGMAHGLEARVPFLDHRIVEWSARLDDRHKIRGKTTKAVLREAFAAAVPAKILERPKRGFDLPLDDWIRGPLRELSQDLLVPSSLERWPGVRADGINEMLQLHLTGRQSFGLPLFNALSVMLFLEAGDAA